VGFKPEQVLHIREGFKEEHGSKPYEGRKKKTKRMWIHSNLAAQKGAKKSLKRKRLGESK